LGAVPVISGIKRLYTNAYRGYIPSCGGYLHGYIYISIVIPTAPRIRPFKRKTVEKNSQLKTGYVLSEEKILQ
jgi:hypothetical protein